MRVHQLAKEYGVKSTDFVKTIQDYGIDVKSHLSGLNDDEVATIRKKIELKEIAIKLENELLERSIGVKEPLDDRDRVDPSSLVLEDVEEEPETEEFNGVEVDEQLNPVDEMEDGEEETDTELSFGQKAFAKAKAEEETEDATEDWSSMKELARQDDDAEWTKKVVEADAKIAVQQVIVEKPGSFWKWLKGLFS